MRGQLQMLLPTLASVIPHVRAGKMRALAVTGARRSPLAPELPTVAEAGVADFQLEAWWGLLGPAKLPASIVQKVNEALNAALAQPDVHDLLVREGAVAHPGTPKQFDTLIRSDLARWTQLVKDANIQSE